MAIRASKNETRAIPTEPPPSYEIAIRSLPQQAQYPVKPLISSSRLSPTQPSTTTNDNDTSIVTTTTYQPSNSQTQSPSRDTKDKNQNRQNNSFLNLPRKIHLNILAHLPWPSLTAIRLTHSHFARHTLPPQILVDLHRLHQTETWNKEVRRLREIGQLHHHRRQQQHTWPHATTSGTSRLPCYHCLRWLPSADHDLQTSAFSRRMATTPDYDLAGHHAKNRRICVDCGIKTGLYPRGSIVKHQPVCYACGELGTEQLPYSTEDSRIYLQQQHANDSRHAIMRRMGTKKSQSSLPPQPDKKLYRGRRLRCRYFCTTCIDEGVVVPETMLEFEHDRSWGRYEVSMAHGKAYRLAKGKMLREQRGIKDVELDRLADEHVYRPRHECPFVKERRICGCWKGKKSLGARLALVESLPWIW